MRIGHVLSSWWTRLSEGSADQTRDRCSLRKLSKPTQFPEDAVNKRDRWVRLQMVEFDSCRPARGCEKCKL